METTEGEQMGKSSVFSHASSVVHTVLLLYYVLYLQTHPLVVVFTGAVIKLPALSVVAIRVVDISLSYSH